MSVVLSILGWIVLSVVGLALFVLCMPLHLEGRGWLADGDGAGRAQARWGWWLVRLRADTRTGVDVRVLGLRVWRLGARSAEARAKRAETSAQSAAPAEKPPRRARGGAWRHRQALLRVLGAVWHTLAVRGHVHGVAGLSDPGDTAVLFGVIVPIAERAEALDIDLEPDWLDDGLDIDGALSVRVWPIHILLALLWLVVRDGQTRRGMWALLRARR